MRKPDYDRRVVVTGLGVVSPVGNDVPTAWDNLIRGNSGLVEITRFDVSRYEAKAAGEVRDFNASKWMDPKAIRRSETSMHFGVSAAKQALIDSGFEITDANREDVGVVFGSGAGGQQLMIEAWVALHEKGPRSVAPTFIANAPRRLDVGDDRDRDRSDRPQRLHRVGLCDRHPQRRRGRRGDPPRRLHRGDLRLDRGAAARDRSCRASRTCAGWACRGRGSRCRRSRGHSTRPATDSSSARGPRRCSSRTWNSPRRAGREIYAEVVGYGSTNDGWDMVQPIDKGTGSSRAMKMALERRGVPADEVDLINPHGTSTPLGDMRETEAIWAVFGEHTPNIAISATKSMTGHMMGAAGAFEAFATVKAVAEQCIPPTINYRDPDPECDLQVVTEATPREIRYAISNNIGLGGHNGAVIFKRYDGD